MEFDREIIDQTTREIMSMGVEPLVCGRCGNRTLYPPGWNTDNGREANGREVCPLCREELKLIDKGVIECRDTTK